ncbi:MAG: PepSY-associated TM helix domain-containing protein [Pseudomonadota bacterium]
MPVSQQFRSSMQWLHTWLGIALGSVLFAIFWMGTLTVFHLEINRWMMPESRVTPALNRPLDPIVMPHLQTLDRGEDTFITISRPTSRSPFVSVRSFGGPERLRLTLDPVTGEQIETTKSYGASGFFYPFHYSLHISWLGLGTWIVGLAALSMLVLTVSGIFLHRKIFADFFSFRPQKHLRRSLLDLHNLTAVVALPFHVLFPLTGILIFVFVYFPNSFTKAYDGDRAELREEMIGYVLRDAAGEPGELPPSVDALVKRAETIWTERSGQPAHADYIRITRAGDANATVMVQHTFPERQVAMNRGNITFDAQTGELLTDFTPRSAQTANAWIKGAHFLRIDSWALRWLFFLGGLAGSVMIATGQLYWMQARIKRGLEPRRVRVVRGLTIGTTTGLILATLAYLIANRLLTNDVRALGFEREMLEVLPFFAVWIVAVLHAALRGRAAWREQSIAICMAAIAAAVLNWATTGDDIVRSAMAAQWAVVGVDSALLVTSGIALWSVRRLPSVSGSPVPAAGLPRRTAPQAKLR